MENTFHETYKRLTPDTKAHADVFNTIFDQLFQNDSLLKENQEIEYITEGSILELCEKKKKSFRFIAYSYVGRGMGRIVEDMPNYGNDNILNFWYGEFQWLFPIVKGSGTYPSDIHCILRVKNLSGEEYIRTVWTLDDTGDGLRFIWDKWIKVYDCSVVYAKDVNELPNGKYFVMNGVNLPKGISDAHIEVSEGHYIKEMLCRDGANMYIKRGYSRLHEPTEWGEWKCISTNNTMPVYVGSTAPENTDVLWVW